MKTIIPVGIFFASLILALINVEEDIILISSVFFSIVFVGLYKWDLFKPRTSILDLKIKWFFIAVFFQLICIIDVGFVILLLTIGVLFVLMAFKSPLLQVSSATVEKIVGGYEVKVSGDLKAEPEFHNEKLVICFKSSGPFFDILFLLTDNMESLDRGSTIRFLGIDHVMENSACFPLDIPENTSATKFLGVTKEENSTFQIKFAP